MTEQQLETAAEANAAPLVEQAADTPPQNPLLREADFYFAADDIDKKVDKLLMGQRHKLAMPGFRRGKVPLSHLRRKYGKGTLQEVLQQELLPKFRDELTEKKESAAAPPHLQYPELSSDGQYKVHCAYEIIPEIGEMDLSDKVIKKPTFTVNDAAVDEMVELLRRQRGSYAATDAAVEGDDYRLRVDFKSFLLPAEGDAAAQEEMFEESTDQMLMMNDKGLHPNLREALQGARVGDARSAEVKVPEEAPNEKLRGRTMRIDVQVQAVEQLQKAELNEEFFKFYGDDHKTVETFRGSVKEHLERESTVRLRNFLHARAMNLLMSATKPFALPQSMLMSECNRLMQEAQAQMAQQGVAKDNMPQYSLSMFVPKAQRRVALGLILSEWQRREKPSISKEDTEARLLEICAAYENPQAAAEQIRSNQTEMEAVYLSVLEDRVTDWVVENCKCEEEEISLADFLNDGAADSA